MASYWNIVKNVLAESDIVLLIADARLPNSVNGEIIEKITAAQKKYVVVYNKVDVVPNFKLPGTYEHEVAVSAKLHLSTMDLLRKLNAIAHGKDAIVGVVGYPNTGKSSVINALKGKGSAGTSSQAGFTKGKQLVRITQHLQLMDTPGVISYGSRHDEILQAVLSAKSANQVKDPEGIAMVLIDLFGDKVSTMYGVPLHDHVDEMLEHIAQHLHLLKKGNQPDTKRAAIRIISDWQKGLF